MATLVRSRNTSRTPLDSPIPTPFPREHLAQTPIELLKGNAVHEVVNPFEVQEEGSAEDPFEDQAGPSMLAESGITTPNTYTLKEVLPSINRVQKTCLMTLNNLLSERIGWHPIVPPRRHSMPSSPVTTSFEDDSNLPFALQTLVANLRDDSNGEMIEIAADDSEVNLLGELRMRVQSLSPSLSLHAATLTKALVELLINLHQLSNIQANIYHLPTQPAKTAINSAATDIPPPIDVFDKLTRQLGDFRTERLSSQSYHPTQELPDLWSRIDADLENVVALCKQRAVPVPKLFHDFPPQYDVDNYDDLESLPDYDAGGRISLEEPKSQKPGTSQLQAAREDEKMRMDLESVAIAIERLYLVAPQLHNQRVELKSSKLAELEGLERARAAASRPRTPLLKNREDEDVRELEQMIEMIGRASARTMIDQSVILDGSMRGRIHRAKQKESAKRNAFVDQLFQHSEAGRIHNQDAEPQTKDPEALLTLPEFMREALPQSERRKDREALLSLPEFVREPIPTHISSKMSKKAVESAKRDPRQKKRSRSLSAPPLAWLKSSASRTVNGLVKTNSQGFDVVYVAENHENLHHILLFFNIIGGVPEADVQAEVMPLFLNLPMDGGDHLFIKSGPHTSLPLMLPAHTDSGKKEVRPQRGHYEIKLLTRQSSESTGNTTPASAGESSSTPLLDASQLATLNPVSFVCTSCSLPLIQSTKINCYRDLPSEHWAELVESWMCHSDQKLNDHVATHGKMGFWPSPGQALVGGSYILFEEGAMNAANLHVAVDKKDEDDWHLARCLCGALIGRHQEREFNNGRSKVYRVVKFAVRPVSPNSEPLKIPLSAFVVQDMMEFVEAHASYRFVIKDEEEEKPRILIWLFKPRIRIAYTSVRHHSIPKSANVLAAKVLFKLLGPSERRMNIKSILDKYPGFPQAEYLSYPMSTCRQLAAMLNDSNSAYPEGLRAMTGLEVGWLQRW